MSLTITIGGVDVTSKIARNSFALTNALGQRDTLALTTLSGDGTYTPEMGAPVVVEHSDFGTMFGGTVRRTQAGLFGAVAVSTGVQCASWEQIFDRRRVGEQKTFTDTPAGDVFQYVFDTWLTFEGLTASIVASGPNITVTLDWCSVREAFDLIAQQASSESDVFMWDCTSAKVTRFYKQTSFPAPINVTESRDDIFRNITVTRTFDQYVNRVYVRLGNYITDERSNTYGPDGTQSTLSFELPLAKTPTVTVNGVEQTVGIRDVDAGKQCYWQDGSPDVTFATPPALGTTVVITAQGYQSTVVDAGQNDDEVTERSIVEGNSGWYTGLIESSTPGTAADAIAYGQAYLAKFSRIPYAVEYQTTQGGIKAGMYQTVSLTKFGPDFSGVFIVESSTLVQENGHWFWRVRAINGALANNWLTRLRQIATGKSSLLGGGGGTVITPGANPLVLTAALPSATVGIGYVGPLIAIGGQTPYTFSIHSGTLPSWATLDTATGVISGTPTYAGTTTFTARVTDSVGTTQDYDCTLVVVAAAVGGGTGAIPPGNVTIDSVEADAKPLTGSAVRGTRNSVAKRGITIRYTPPEVTYVPSTITFAQGKSLALGWGYVSSVSLTLDASVSTGQLILVAIRWDSDYSLPLSVSDSAGNSYTLINETGRSSAGWYHQAVYYAYATSSGTVTISGAWTGGDGFSPSISAAVFSGASGAPEATDVTEVSYSGTSSIASGSITPAETGCAIVSFAGSNGAITFSGHGGSLLASQTATDHAIGCTYQVLSSTAAVTNGVGYVSGDAYVGVLTTVLFRAATTASSTFRGVYVQVEAPDQTTAYATRGGRPGRFLDGSLALSAVDLSGPRAPYTFGPFPHSETDGSLRVQIPEPDASQLPMNARARVISYSDDVTNSAETSPSQTFIIADPTPSKPASGTAYTFNPVRVLIPATVPGSGVRGAAQANPYRTTASGVDETHLWVTIDLDPRAYGYQLVLVNPWGDHLSASGIETAPHFELVFNTPGAVGTYVVYACGSDGTNINPLVDGITPSVAVTLGTDDGTVDLKQTTANSRGRGLDVEDDALCVKIAGPLYEDVAGNINLKISPHFTVSTDGTLTQDIVDLSLATGFDTSAFSGGGGGSSLTIKASWITAQAIAVNQLVAGNALFAGDATFARIGGGKVTINSAGIAIADNLTTPTATVTATSSGVTVAKGTNNVQVTALGVSINGPSGSLTASAGGIVIANGSSSVTVSSSAVTIVNGSLSSPTITGGSISGASLSISSGTTTVNIDSANYVRVFDSNVSATCRMAPGAIEVLGNLDSSQAALQTASGVGILRLRNGANTVTFELYPVTSSTANAGVATLPSNPAGFISAKVNGITVKIPYYGN